MGSSKPKFPTRGLTSDECGKDSGLPFEASELDEFLPSNTRIAAPLQRRSYVWLVALCNLFLFCISIASAALAFNERGKLDRNVHNALVRRMDAYSPVHSQVDIPLVDVTVNGTLLYMDNSVFRGPPSPEVDAAWERISSLLPHVVSTEEVVKLGKDPSKTARWPADWGFGPDAHIAELDVLHTIHCLNAIRRDVHWQYYFKDEYPDGSFPELHRVHTDHCIHIVLQNLMCSATADIITQPWVEGQLHPFPDFNVNKKCRDFETLLSWHEATMVRDMDRFKTIRMPDGHVPYRMSAEFQRMFGVEGNLHAGMHAASRGDHEH
ncbi:hypothetical protein KC363_g6449 [Hortaea werneckii]|uniref:Tat pathway signal sequence n=2 Tax=Hortaea werneckii TaxID=91943 RepID=A0A3M7F8S4_HORWE|nr:hypothetical protein KC361_g453 [Hortaea werneckii]OTA26425.1 hypothetical protein BTJ68_10584 [Hortaea werneckii EXF-2000]KAI6835506.1 hypothetical protein KC358_g5577 [Hortaea werneckii]KAI6844219.1 hypothetical protein KC350_g4830 [Hortaea werneckii]KAI6887156.1 hypothetical protein KC325_g2304 [Hortaea werneckii]